MKVGVIGGSGLYGLEALQEVRQVSLETPFGAPSAPLVQGRLRGKEVVFLPRHGEDHRLLPSEIPFRANIWALKKLGVTHLLSVSAVGSLREDIVPGQIVFPHQFIDRTCGRAGTFFGRGVAAHISLADPICLEMTTLLERSAAALGISAHRGGVYVCIEGPAFSTRAESHMYRAWGGTVIGMTNLPEARLAREAQLCFSTIALATDYDCWRETETAANVEDILRVMRENIDASRRLLEHALEAMPEHHLCAAHTALHNAVLTPAERIPAETRRELALILGEDDSRTESASDVP